MIERLKIIPTDSVVSFEVPCEDRVARIADDVSREGKLRNPLLVGPLDGDFLLLDNVSVLQALISLKVDHIPVQLADLDQVSVRPWQRLVMGLSIDDMMSFFEKFPRQMHMIEAVNGSLEPNQLEVRFDSGERLRVDVRARSILVRAGICNMLYAEISRRHRTFRDKVNYRAQDPFKEYPEVSAILFPPVFSLEELAYIARHNEHLPHGFVRTDQPGRVLGIDFSLSVLKERVSIEEKESFLCEMLKLRLSLDRVAYYNGAVFMYNN